MSSKLEAVGEGPAQKLGNKRRSVTPAFNEPPPHPALSPKGERGAPQIDLLKGHEFDANGRARLNLLSGWSEAA